MSREKIYIRKGTARMSRAKRKSRTGSKASTGILKECRADVRMCKAIFADADKLKEKYQQAQALSKQTIKETEVSKNEHERRSR